MPDYKIRDPNTGRVITLRGESPPTEQELEQMFATQGEATPPPAWATEGMGAPSTTAMPEDVSERAYHLLGSMSPREAGEAGLRETREHPIRTAAIMAAPGILGMAGRYGPPAARAAATAMGNVLAKPAVGATIGGAEGYRQGGWTGAAVGAGAGYAGSSNVAQLLKRLKLGGDTSGMVQGMSRASSPVAGEHNIDDMIAAAIAQQRKANPSGVFGDDAGVPLSAPTPATQRDALLEQVSMRDPDWRLVDAVPITARQTKGIIEAGESRVGLAERAAQAAKTGDAEEVDRLLKALRQRMHISATRTGK
jgi:hypothetical protein